MNNGIRLTIIATLACAVVCIALPVRALPWGPDGHDGIVYETAKALDFSEEAAKALALGSVAPDWYEFTNDAAHAQTPDKKSGEPTMDEKRRAYEECRTWIEKYERSAADAVKRGNTEQALFLYGYALHGIMDYATHRGMTASQHGLLARRGSNPDEDAKSIQDARRETAYILGKLGRSENGARLREFARGPGNMDLRTYTPSGKGTTNVAVDMAKIAGESLIGEKGTKIVKEGLSLYLSLTSQVKEFTINKGKIETYLARPNLKGQPEEIIAYATQYRVGSISREQIVDWPSQLGTDSPGVIIRGETPDWGALPTPKGDAKPGGVLLDGVARALFEMDDLVGATYDPKRKELILVGALSKKIPFDPDYWFVALRAAEAGEAPCVSIDPGPKPEELNVRYCGPVKDTKLGRVMFEADRLLKNLIFGTDNVTGREVPDIPTDLPSPLALGDSEMLALPKDGGGVASRFWIQNGEMMLDVTGDGRSVMFAMAEMRVNTEVMTPDAPPVFAKRNAKFADYMTSHYDELASRWDVLEELRQAAKAVAVATWLRGRVPFHPRWTAAEPMRVQTPETTPALTRSRKVARPLWTSEYRVTGGVDLALSPNAIRHGNDRYVNNFFNAARDARPVDAGRQQTRTSWAAGVASILLVLFVSIGKGWKCYLCGAVAGIVAGAATYALVPWWHPTRIAPVWTFSAAVGSGTFVAAAFPVDLEKTAPQGYLTSGLPRIPSFLGRWQRERIGDWGPLVKIFVSSECNRTVHVYWDGMRDLDVPPGAKNLVLELPLGMREIKAVLPDAENPDLSEVINLTRAYLHPPEPITRTFFCPMKMTKAPTWPDAGQGGVWWPPTQSLPRLEFPIRPLDPRVLKAFEKEAKRLGQDKE